ncbi:3-phosphoshikimate 1-carboxyvinyltransferase [Phytoactinopolyspora halotolerans]|uniref:3-phosphoshikimate 1-carboxyvinyltransferase n=1 Tax=Phytoactinopolyspora halotolerans TaxID=1981512 RepID=A0A6L9S7S0_9ACTN|nr:3-phosphoshikimate 1-carboxyvinyltransferase [Phytoactinopolyspora halotolerans]NEE01216.1 3-phosphoshikimate 1-carboxyvinyltransferase [Phytoactinopolyspora halotolerans]
MAEAEVRVPGSKSVTARALFLSACAEGTSLLRHPLLSDDTEAFAAGLDSLGYGIEQEVAEWRVDGSSLGPRLDWARVHCRDAGTAARFLPALAACGRGTYAFDASDQMRARPVRPVVQALEALGATVRYDGAEGHLPFAVEASGLRGGHITMDAGDSSQFLTAVLMAAPLTDQGVTVDVSRIVSTPYVEMTLAMMRRFGGEAEIEEQRYRVPSGFYQPQDYEIEPDASTSSYFFAAAALTGHTITVPGLGSCSLQGDLNFVEVLGQMGAEVNIAQDRTTVTGTGSLGGIEVNMRDISDTMPTLAAIAPFADGPVRITDVYNTRLKECDRLDACVENLERLGVAVRSGRDWIEILPGVPKGGVIACRRDHRIAMSFSVTGLRCEGVVLDDPGCVRKTFPSFHEALERVRAAWDVTPGD